MEASKKNKSKSLFLNASPNIFENARNLRKRMTTAEKKLWFVLRRKSINGKRFRRQHPVDKYIADFYCHEAKLIIEIDGNVHLNEAQKEHDKKRTFELKMKGINLIRFTNEEVLFDIDNVINVISKNVSIPHSSNI